MVMDAVNKKIKNKKIYCTNSNSNYYTYDYSSPNLNNSNNRSIQSPAHIDTFDQDLCSSSKSSAKSHPLYKQKIETEAKDCVFDCVSNNNTDFTGLQKDINHETKQDTSLIKLKLKPNKDYNSNISINKEDKLELYLQNYKNKINLNKAKDVTNNLNNHLEHINENIDKHNNNTDNTISSDYYTKLIDLLNEKLNKSIFQVDIDKIKEFEEYTNKINKNIYNTNNNSDNMEMKIRLNKIEVVIITDNRKVYFKFLSSNVNNKSREIKIEKVKVDELKAILKLIQMTISNKSKQEKESNIQLESDKQTKKVYKKRGRKPLPENILNKRIALNKQNYQYQLIRGKNYKVSKDGLLQPTRKYMKTGRYSKKLAQNNKEKMELNGSNSEQNKKTLYTQPNCSNNGFISECNTSYNYMVTTKACDCLNGQNKELSILNNRLFVTQDIIQENDNNVIENKIFNSVADNTQSVILNINVDRDKKNIVKELVKMHIYNYSEEMLTMNQNNANGPAMESEAKVNKALKDIEMRTSKKTKDEIRNIMDQIRIQSYIVQQINEETQKPIVLKTNTYLPIHIDNK